MLCAAVTHGPVCTDSTGLAATLWYGTGSLEGAAVHVDPVRDGQPVLRLGGRAVDGVVVLGEHHQPAGGMGGGVQVRERVVMVVIVVDASE
jgi:hypothetical protein